MVALEAVVDDRLGIDSDPVSLSRLSNVLCVDVLRDAT